jgi:hypothetical protein
MRGDGKIVRELGRYKFRWQVISMGSNRMCVIKILIGVPLSEPGYCSQCSDYATGWMTEESGFDFSLLRNGQPTSYIAGPGVVSLKLTRPGREADHLTPPSANVKNDGPILPLPNKSLWHSAHSA